MKSLRILRQLLVGAVIVAGGSYAALKIDQMGDATYKGQFTVVDGDTLRFQDQRMRLLGFDAPELKQRCGEETDSWACGQAAKKALQALVDKPGFHCKGGRTDKYRRLLVFCFVGEEDVGEIMVKSGMALATQRLLYQREEQMARQEGLGLWSGSFDRPVDWRQMHQRAELGLPLMALLMVVRRSIGW